MKLAFLAGLLFFSFQVEAKQCIPDTSTISLSIPNPVDGSLSVAQVMGQVWDIVQKNKPVVNVSSLGTSALPIAAKDNWAALVGWQKPRTVHSAFQLHNQFGQKVMDVQYDVNLLFGGSVHGKGSYIQFVQVLPRVDVNWGYNLNGQVNVVSTYNVGTTENPIAAILLEVKFRYSTPFYSRDVVKSFLVQGDGVMKNVTSGRSYFRAAPKPELCKNVP